MLKKKKDANAPEVNAEETAATAPEEEMEEEVMTGEPEEIEEEYEEEDPIRAELAEQKERYLRLAAEYDNYRKRTQREKTLIGAESRADCVAALLPVMESPLFISAPGIILRRSDSLCPIPLPSFVQSGSIVLPAKS